MDKEPSETQKRYRESVGIKPDAPNLRRGRDRRPLVLSVSQREYDVFSEIVAYYKSNKAETFRTMVRYFEIHLDLPRLRDPSRSDRKEHS